MTGQPEPADVAETIRVLQQQLATAIDAVKRLDREVTELRAALAEPGPTTTQTTEPTGLREQLAAAISPVLDAHPEHNRTDEHEHVVSEIAAAVLAAVAAESPWLKATAEDLAAAEQRVKQIAELRDRWVTAGPPPLGTSINRWWDRRLAELHAALQPAAHNDGPTVEECRDADRAHWTTKYAGEGQ